MNEYVAMHTIHWVWAQSHNECIAFAFDFLLFSIQFSHAFELNKFISRLLFSSVPKINSMKQKIIYFAQDEP